VTALNDWVIWAIVVAGSILTYALRGSFIFLYSRIGDPPAAFERSLEFVPAAVLSALVLPNLLVQDGQIALSLANNRLIAGVAALAAAWITENLFVTIAAGMVVFWGLRFLV